MKQLHRMIGIIILVTVLVAAPATMTISAQPDQQDAAACPAITLQALEATQELCTDATNNEACYGHVMLDAQPQPNVANFKFDTEGDIASIADMASLRLSAMDTTTSEWGVALMRLRANLLEEAKRELVMLLLFGDVEITNDITDVPSTTFPATVSTDGSTARVRSTPNGLRIATLDDGDEVIVTGRNEDGSWIRVQLDSERSAWIASFLLRADEAFDMLDVVGTRSAMYAPMQAFYMTSDANDAACPEAPNSGLMIQTPEGVAHVTFLINEVDIQLGSTVFFQAQPGQAMTISVVEGSATVTAQGVSRRATQGSFIMVPLNEHGLSAGIPSLPQAYDPSSVEALPTAFMDDPVPVAAPISETDLAVLLANQPEDEETDKKVFVCHNGNTIEISINALDAHLAHGDTEGACEITDPSAPPPSKAVVCHNGVTIEISVDALPAHLAHGDTEGACTQ